MYPAFTGLASTQQEGFTPNTLIHPMSQIRSLKNHWTYVQMCHKVDLPSTTTQEIRTTDERSKLQEGSRHHEEKKIQTDMVQKYMVTFAKTNT